MQRFSMIPCTSQGNPVARPDPAGPVGPPLELGSELGGGRTGVPESSPVTASALLGDEPLHAAATTAAARVGSTKRRKA
jgi:hypothetical protein